MFKKTSSILKANCRYGLLVTGIVVSGCVFALGSSVKNVVTIETDLSQAKQVVLSSGEKVLTLPTDTRVISLRSGDKVIKKQGEAPYCLVGCDLPIDCEGNKSHVPIPPNKQWACDNKPGFCVGHCYLTDKSSSS